MSSENTHSIETSTATDVESHDGRHAPKLQNRLNATASVLGKKWHLVILYRLTVSGPLGFSALHREIDGISSKVLSNSLAELESRGLIERRIINERPLRVEYSLTDCGRLFQPIITTIRDDFDDLDWVEAE